MSDPFIPSQDPDALIWMQNFASVLTANFATYFVSSADALAISNAVNIFSAALTIAKEPGTRTPVNVAIKDDARTAAEQICRQFAGLIRVNAGISDPDKILAGVRPQNNSREPIPAPSTSPLVNVIAATSGGQTLRYSDTMTPDSPAKPFGATDLLLFVAITDDPVVDPDAAQFYGKFTKNPIAVLFTGTRPMGDHGQKIIYVNCAAGVDVTDAHSYNRTRPPRIDHRKEIVDVDRAAVVEVGSACGVEQQLQRTASRSIGPA